MTQRKIRFFSSLRLTASFHALPHTLQIPDRGRWPGAIGLYYGGKLAHFGRDVHFLLRSGFEVVRQERAHLRGKNEITHLAKVNSLSLNAGNWPLRSGDCGCENDLQYELRP